MVSFNSPTSEEQKYFGISTPARHSHKFPQKSTQYFRCESVNLFSGKIRCKWSAPKCGENSFSFEFTEFFRVMGHEETRGKMYEIVESSDSQRKVRESGENENKLRVRCESMRKNFRAIFGHVGLLVALVLYTVFGGLVSRISNVLFLFIYVIIS